MDSWFFPFFFPACLDLWDRGSGGGKEPSGDNILRLIRIRCSDAESAENYAG